MKEVAFKKYLKKYFTRLYFSRYPFIPINPLLVAMSFFFFSFSKILNAQFPKRHNTEKKQNCIKCAIATYKHFKQNLQCTNNANKVRKILLKKVLVTELDPPKDFKKSTRLVSPTTPLQSRPHCCLFFCFQALFCFATSSNLKSTTFLFCSYRKK